MINFQKPDEIIKLMESHKNPEYDKYIEQQRITDKKRLILQKYNQRLAISGLYSRYLKSTWDFNDKSKKIKDIFTVLAKKKIGLYITGGLGRGKSSILTLIAKELLKKQVVKYCLITDIGHDSFNKDLIKSYMVSPVLILDDFGWQYTNNKFAELELVRILKYRYGNELLTYIGANLTVEELPQTVENKQIKDLILDKTFMRVVVINTAKSLRYGKP